MMDIIIHRVLDLDNHIFEMFKELIHYESAMGKYFNLIQKDKLDENIRDFFEKIFKREDNRVFKAFYKGDPAGYIIGGLMTRPPFHEKKMVGFIEDLYVKSEFRYLGIARELTKHVENFLHCKGADDCTLFIMAQNQGAERAYAKLGYEVEGLRLSKMLE